MNRVEFRKKILAANDAEAAMLNEKFAATGTFVVDLVSSPGSGKTSLLEATALQLADSVRVGCVVGDIATELDAQRLRNAGLPAHQIVTGGACHLDARLVREGLETAGFGELDLLFIENVGNLVCPASYALGDDVKVALLSVAEGHDKPFKYPAIFARADVSLITKIDLLPHVDFDIAVAREQIRSLNPDAEILEISTRAGKGIDAWCRLLRTRSAAKAAVAPAP
ncbi:MAG: hydrogenase nickel incorporation protein HypB [Deltaproteobacteria bacterium]|nr:hydrogenase nickel incorporation protein HypB [Deltaproteobacteria bacterium]